MLGGGGGHGCIQKLPELLLKAMELRTQLEQLFP